MNNHVLTEHECCEQATFVEQTVPQSHNGKSANNTSNIM